MGPVPSKAKSARFRKIMNWQHVGNEGNWPCRNEWAAPIVFAAKEDGSLKFFVYYQKLDAGTACDFYPYSEWTSVSIPSETGLFSLL